MPVLLAYTTARKLNSNQFLVLLQPESSVIQTGPLWLQQASLLLSRPAALPVRYTGSVIPIVLVMLVQAPLEKFLNKNVPQASAWLSFR
ncbi:hypothetical protein [Allobaculum sp. JKK-2023]|uniref:hypothetical protein n=1 Tax=Allobaculum sp. JKK-2023 TaxID=3108943 RepID=UPI002B059C45|nr:hypothetical protein [Allobaculum sp. JKK-2023]